MNFQPSVIFNGKKKPHYFPLQSTTPDPVPCLLGCLTHSPHTRHYTHRLLHQRIICAIITPTTSLNTEHTTHSQALLICEINPASGMKSNVKSPN